jgi:hypothetical protein
MQQMVVPPTPVRIAALLAALAVVAGVAAGGCGGTETSDPTPTPR